MQKFISDRPQVLAAQAVFPVISVEQVAAEPSLLSNSPLAVRAQGGTLSKLALAHIEEHYAADIKRAEKEGLSAVVDVRVQRLMPRMYPAVPGWHCDAVPRSGYDGEPRFELVNPAAFHVAVILSSSAGGVSNTQFMDQAHRFGLWTQEGRTVFSGMHEDIEGLKPQLIQARDGEFVRYTPRTPLRAMPCVKKGSRMELRFSMVHKPPLSNTVMAQQQAYLLSEANGW